MVKYGKRIFIGRGRYNKNSNEKLSIGAEDI
jgi:hypothetical protein